MNDPLSPTLSATIAIVLISVTAMGAGADSGTAGSVSSPIAAPASRSLDGKTFVAKDNAIEATSIWTRERWYWKIKREYWYRGQLKE